MKENRSLMAVTALLALAASLGAASSPRFAYSVWVGAAPDADINRPADSTLLFDDGWHQRERTSDQVVLSRKSPASIRLHERSGRWAMRIGGAWKPAECGVGPFGWALAPSGRIAVCVAGNYPNQSLHVLSMADGTRVAVIRVPAAYIEGRNKIAFADDDTVLYAALDDSCPRERASRLQYSIAALSVSRRDAGRIRFRCASGVVVGTSRTAYLRENGTQYTVGGAWVNESLYGFDANDEPITDREPALQRLTSTGPGIKIWMVSAGEASVSPRI